MTNADAPCRPSADDLADLPGCDHIELRPGGREEIVDGVSEGFPYALVYSQHDRYQGRSVPWHWHQELELFYVLEGPVDYATPHERLTLPTGSAGIVNANVLHMTRATDDGPNVNLLIHMFRPQLLAERDGLLWRSYVEPLIRETPVELVYDVPRGPEGETALGGRVLAAFRTALARERGWELRLRSELTEAWLEVLTLAQDRLGQGPNSLAHPRDERLKAMIDYIGRHYDEHIGVRDIAGSAFASERECYRTFGECLGVTPTHYLRDYRIQQACRMLAHTTRPIAAVASMVGMGSPSRFGQEFRLAMGCTPSEYRARWQDSDSSGRGRL